MEDLIRKLNLPVAKDQQYSETQKSYYADCHGNFIVAVQKGIRQSDGHIQYVKAYSAILSFHIQNDDIDAVFNQVREAEKQPTFYEVIHKSENDFLLLDDDKEIRDLYTEFREKDYRYYCSYMSCSRKPVV